MKKNPNPYRVVLITFLLLCTKLHSQQAPGKDMNIPYLVTFGKESETKWGDHDFVQTFFIEIPIENRQPFYIRVYDPETGGKNDEAKLEFNTRTKFTVYGGKGTISAPDAVKDKPVGSKLSGISLNSKIFDKDLKYDGGWYSFGPFNPSEGELYTKEYSGYIFKIVAEGLSGDDGNLYRYFISTKKDENIAIEGANIFSFEYTFRLFDEIGSISHIYPFVTDDVVAVHIKTFDLDEDSYMRLVSVAKRGEKIKGSPEDQWTTSIHTISEEEKKTSLDIQIIKSKSKTNNNMVIAITNQYGKNIPFYNVPIGGIPKFKYTIKTK